MADAKLKKLVSKLFKDDYGQPLDLAPTQLKIVEIIAKKLPRNKKKKRHIAMTVTQYGKSLAIAVGLILRTTADPDKFGVIGPTKEKARIIQDYVTQHCFDHPLFLSQLDVDIPLERLKRERSKDRLTFRRGGEVRVFTADQRNKNNAKKALMGFGAPNLVIDESSLLEDDVYATAKRMVGGHRENFIFEIGNPFYRNHFLTTWTQSKNYNKLFVDWKQAIKEGRLDKETVEEMRSLPLFDILYEVKFPAEEEMDERGYRVLLTAEQLATAIVKQGEIRGKKKLGVDIARGGNWNLYVIRDSDFGYIKHRDKVKDLMVTAGKIQEIVKEEGIDWTEVYIDDSGVGGGVVNRLGELGFEVNNVVEGERAENSERFANSRAEGYWGVRQWILDGGKIKGEQFWELKNIKFKINSSGKIQMEPKEEMRKRGIPSPDAGDALMLTFTKKKAKEADISFIDM
ncbi:hypothetical protein [Caldithrix abyssi]